MFYKISGIRIPRDGAICEDDISQIMQRELASNFLADPKYSLVQVLQEIYHPTIILGFSLEKIELSSIPRDEFLVVLYLHKNVDRRVLTLPELQPLIVREFLILAR